MKSQPWQVWILGWMGFGLVAMGAPGAYAAQPAQETKELLVCVDVELQETEDEAEEQEQDARAHSQAAGIAAVLPLGQTPVVYLQRLFEYYVTHAVGYASVREGCSEHIEVELYPLAVGWTAFARFSKNGREERVDQLLPSELSQFAERAVEALLADVPISRTINRDNVLQSDSKKSIQRIRGENRFILGLGTQLRGGNLKTAKSGGGTGTELGVRLFSPMTLSAGYRGKFEGWGLESVLQLGLGTSKSAAWKNPSGGHVDFGGDVGGALHFLHFMNPRGLTSFYLGAGGTFELLWFSAIKAEGKRGDGDRSTILGGGLTVDLLTGWELMRANNVQFYLQGELNLPAYSIDVENNDGAIHTWFPGASLKIGMAF